MRILTSEQQELAEKNMHISQLAYSKLQWSIDLTPYREELLAEGYYGICKAAALYDVAKSSNSFYYFFSAAINEMIEFVQTFIFPTLSLVSLDTEDEAEQVLLMNAMRTVDKPSCEFFIQDLLNEYIDNINKDLALSNYKKEKYSSPAVIKMYFNVLKLLADGYTIPEIATLLSVSKQALYMRLKKFCKYLNKE